MTKLLSQIFMEAKSPCITWEGEPLFGLVEIPALSKFDVTFSRAKQHPVQGITLKCVNGKLLINDIEAVEMVVWADTAPVEIKVAVLPTGKVPPRLKIWNVWRGKVGGVDVKQAWLGNAGMRVAHQSDGLRMRCSDGEGPIDFHDLVADLRFHEPDQG